MPFVKVCHGDWFATHTTRKCGKKRISDFPLDRFAARLSFEQKARLLREVARGLSVAHEQGVVHRDLSRTMSSSVPNCVRAFWTLA
jgi:serine/threonine protein kinase